MTPDLIVETELRCRSHKLFTVRELAGRTGLSVTTIRKVLHRMEEDRRVERTLEMSIHGRSANHYQWHGN